MRYTLLLAGLLTSGCASQPVRFSHATADDRTYIKDRYQCLQEARGQHAQGSRAGYESKGVVNGGLFRSCMSARGYRPDPNGQFAPPPGTEAATID